MNLIRLLFSWGLNWTMFVERRNEFRNVFEQMLHQQEAGYVLIPHLSIEKAARRRPFEQEYDFQFEV